jgi:choline dehydrogenase-like flavoprotein
MINGERTTGAFALGSREPSGETPRICGHTRDIMSSRPDTGADAIVVGAGLNGSWVAKELASGGMKVTLIDAGEILPNSTFSIDHRQTDVFNLRYHLFRLKLLLKGDTDLALSKFINRRTAHLFLDRRRDPYLTPPDRHFLWTRSRVVGGRGHLWGRVMLRVTDCQLTYPGFEWPVRYNDLAEYYSEVERVLEMGGAPSGLSEVPDGEYAHERSLHPYEKKFSNVVTRRWPHRRVVVNHIAQYEPAPLSPMLRAALSTGRLTLQPDAVVISLATNGPNMAVTGVNAICPATGMVTTYRAPFVILAASAFETVRVLLNSKCERYPNGVGNSSGLLGTRILEHMNDSLFGPLPRSMRAKNPKYRHNPFKLNEEPHGFYIPPFAHAENTDLQYRFSYGMQGTISADTGIYYLAGFGETVPSDRNRLRLDPNRKDRFGVPLVDIDFSWSEEDIAMWRDIKRAVGEMTSAFCQESGIELANSLPTRVHNMLATDRPPVPGSNHECGGARMGTEPSSSVLDPYNRLWDAPNVLVCDAACFPSLPCQNPTLTTMALAIRASRKLLVEN